MTGAATVGAGVLALEVRGETPAGRRGAASRRRFIALALASTAGASALGAALGLVKQPDPKKQLENLIASAAAAIDVAHSAETRARAAEARARELQKELDGANARIAALSATGAAQEIADYEEAQKLGVGWLMKNSVALWGDERRRVMAAIVRESRRNGLDPMLVAAVIHVESRFDPYALSGVGARGLMQLMPPTAQWLLEKGGAGFAGDGQSPQGAALDDVELKLRPSHLFNPVLNIELGTMYLAQLLDRFDGDLQQALVAYNAGPGVARSLRRGSQSWKRLQAYPKSVLAAYRTLLTRPPSVAAN